MKGLLHKRYFLSIGLLLSAIGISIAQTANIPDNSSTTKGAGKSIEETALKLMLESPSFQSEIYSLQSMEAELKTTSNLPDPEVGGEYMVMPEDVDNRWTAQITWGLDWPGVYHAKGKEAKNRIDAADKAVYAQRVDKLTEIKDLLLDYILCRQKCNLLNELDKNNQEIYKLSEAKAENREMHLLDLNKVKIEYSNIKNALAALYLEESQIIGSLSEIYGKDCREILEKMDCRFPDIYIPADLDIATVKTTAPSIQTAMAEAETARQGKKVVKMEALPSLSIGYKHQFEDGMHFNGAVLGISVPIFSSRGKKKAAEAQIIEANYKVEITTEAIETEMNVLLNRLILLKQQIDEISPYVENIDYNTILLKAYEESLISLLDYITERNYFTNALIEFVALRHEAAKTRNGLNKYLQTYNF